MRLTHVDLQVSDVDAARSFFERFFGLTCTYQRQKQIVFFKDQTGFEFALSNLLDLPPPAYPPNFHIGFILEHTSEVREIYECLQSADVTLKMDLSEQGPNLVFQCLGPDSIPVEVRAPKDH
jgi:catechol 2,3-dioxygenase-like lactoylglutathione lyase family enzyme